MNRDKGESYVRSSGGVEGALPLVHTHQSILVKNMIEFDESTNSHKVREKAIRVFRCSKCHQVYRRGKGLLSLIFCPSCRSSEVGV